MIFLCAKSDWHWQYEGLGQKKGPSDLLVSLKPLQRATHSFGARGALLLKRPSMSCTTTIIVFVVVTINIINIITSRGERIVFWRPNTNTNIIRFPKTDRIRIQILFGLPTMTEYEYEYYSAPQKRPNMNTNIIRLPKSDRIRIRILFGFPKMTEYEYKYYSTL